MRHTFFDTHTHYNHPAFAEDEEAVREKIRRIGVKLDAVIGFDLPSSRCALELAEEFVKMGFLLGVGGVVTRPNAKKLQENACRLYRLKP
ncbi:MAG: hypothetical protein IKN79_03565 [Eubacterium sp.]|nr:hypothetical protein [Eubacterium sp.]